MEEHKRKYPSIAGILLFGKDPQRFIPESFIICSHFSGIDGRDVNATIDCTGDLFSQLSTAINFVTSRLNKQFVITKIKRSQTLEIPEVALREIIINAIVHRDYSISGSIKIAIYDDRVEIFSPGSFPGPINVNQLETGVTYIRNHTICKLFREAGYIEKLGSGFLSLFKSYRDYQLAEPQVIEGNHFIKCILPRSPRADDHDPEDPKKLLIKLFASNNQISASEIANELTISRQTAARWLSTLVKEKKIKVIGKGPATRYQKLN
jgi:ATP-dependent DNA helicase RecG